LHDDSSVRSYLDCAWISTDILKRNSLDTPEDADVVIGYLFMGDLEQLVIVPSPTAVGQQCSGTKVPLVDPSLLMANRRGRRTKGRKGVDYHSSTSWKTSSEDEDDDFYEGSGSEGSALGEPQYEVEWSEWSECSSTCGTGSQSRYSRCVDDGSRLELCMEAGGERTETRTCSREPCLSRRVRQTSRISSTRLCRTIPPAINTASNIIGKVILPPSTQRCTSRPM
ncbi:hypothetical protein L9F63_021096, partial [Diploptera punctata]